jgi:hypothetical protein
LLDELDELEDWRLELELDDDELGMALFPPVDVVLNCPLRSASSVPVDAV